MMLPFFELRQYPMLPGRLAEFHALMGGEAQSLFARHGFGKPAGFWESHAGPFSPALIYLLPWNSLAARNAAWDAFYADPDWIAALTENFGGAPRVDHAHVSMLTASPLAAHARPAEGIDEMWTLDASSASRAEKAFLSVWSSGSPPRGAVLRGAFRTVWGAPRSRIVLFLTWPEGEIAGWDREMRQEQDISFTRQRLLTLPYGKPAPVLMDAAQA